MRVGSVSILGASAACSLSFTVGLEKKTNQKKKTNKQKNSKICVI
jgi:hypothetical protein